MFVCFSKGFGFRVFGVFRLSHSRQVGKTSQLGASSKAETVTGFRLYCFFLRTFFRPPLLSKAHGRPYMAFLVYSFGFSD